jgi:hypothetical protein
MFNRLRFPFRCTAHRAVLPFGLALLAAPAVARAQQAGSPPAQAPQAAMLSACYVPDVGVIYMIKQSGLPSACLGSSHVEITWPADAGAVADASITTAKLADQAVTSAKLADDAVTGDKIADGSVTAADLAAGATLADNSVTTSKLADNAVTTVKLVDNAVTGPKIQAGTIDATRLVSGAVGTAQLANQAVTSAKLAPNSVSSSIVASNSLDSTDLAPSSVGSSEIANGSITSADIAAGAVGSAAIANGSILAEDLAASAVSTSWVFASATGNVQGGTAGHVTAQCPAGYDPVGGGFSTAGQIYVNGSYPESGHWRVDINNPGSPLTQVTVTAYAMCYQVTP